MLRPALLTQYSGRLALAARLEMLVMKTMRGGARPASTWAIMRFATVWLKKNGPRRLIPRTRS